MTLRKERPARFRALTTKLLPTFIGLCFFLSGAAGLVYELLWIRMIDKVIGSAPFAVATVLTIFMGGLALGSNPCSSAYSNMYMVARKAGT